jgi:sulfite exporter TauE/SafE
VFGVILVLMERAGWLHFPTPPAIDADASLWLVFITGLTAGGLSCFAVQGGLLATTMAQRALSRLETQVNSQGPLLPILLFLGTKLLAYTLLGALLGDVLALVLLGGLPVFIPCGITQVMELLALGFGSAVQGALIMAACLAPAHSSFSLACLRSGSVEDGRGLLRR